MAVTAQFQTLRSGGGFQNELQIGREDIVFYNVAPGLLRIEVTVSNLGDQLSAPTELRLQSAPFGAFLPWEDLTIVEVPALEAGDSITVHTEVPTPHPPVRGRMDDDPPNRVLTALDFMDEPERESGEVNVTVPLRELKQPGGKRGSRRLHLLRQLLTNPTSEMMKRSVHWAGNINVLRGNTSVERHLAQALRIYPGVFNFAMFCVGDQRPDEYAFGLAGEGACWDAELTSGFPMSFTRMARQGDRLQPGHWYPASVCTLVVLGIEPPLSCERGEVQVHVTRRSTGRRAVVEFSLDAAAQGPGCYTL